MKRITARLPVWCSVGIYFLVMALATSVAGILPFLNELWFFFLLALVMSWLFLRAGNRNPLALVWVPGAGHAVKQFSGGVVMGVLMLVVTALITLALTGDRWTLNLRTDAVYILITFMFCLWSAFVQEFVFRGYPFQSLLKRYNPVIAQLVVAVPFGLMHVNGGMSGTDVATVMLTTGLGSVLFGLAYLRTGGLLLPTGLHLGWNWAQQLLPRAGGGDPKALLTLSGNHPFRYDSFDILVPYLAVVAVAILLLRYFSPFTPRPVQPIGRPA